MLSWIAPWFRLALRRWRTLTFGVCCMIVACVSVHDAMLVILNRDLIYEFERNPLGRWLIRLQGGEVWLFVLVKLMSTAIVCGVLITLHRHRHPFSLPVAAALASFQVGLLGYLLLA